MKDIYDGVLNLGQDINNLGQDINNKLMNIPDHPCRLDQNYQTIEECNALISRLNNLHNNLLKLVQGTSSRSPEKISILRGISSGDANALKCKGVVTAIFAVILAALALISKPSKDWLIANRVYEPTSFGLSSSSYSVTSQSVTKPWYATGFPKPNGCGGGTPVNGKWYPVFIKYSNPK